MRMQPAQRLEAIKRIANALCAPDYQDVGITLTTFGAEDTGYDSYAETERDYVLRVLSDSSDKTISSLDSYLTGDQSASPEYADSVWESGDFRLFVSHTYQHKDYASKFSEFSKRLGIHAFVAHDTIEPTTEWQREIEAALESCDALFAVITDDFIESKWCDQEVGFALGRKAPIVTLKRDADPYGFVGKFQAVTASRNEEIGTAEDVDSLLRALLKIPGSAAKISPIVVRRFTLSKYEESAVDSYKILKQISSSNWSQVMIEEIDRAIETNAIIRTATLEGRPLVDVLSEDLQPLRTDVPREETDEDIPF